ncbi:hypothetical protein [Streptomyces sp. NPDC051921]|uniref:hypothetical protein n=1 Tax=Streptomyces sp. NPDC051921 TaxID=3155806 RepID=UPI00341346D2
MAAGRSTLERRGGRSVRRGGGRVPVRVFAEYVKGATGTGALGGNRLEASYDEGVTWTKVALDGRGRGELRVPAGAGPVSLRAGASDDRGGSVTQEIIRAVGVK